MLSTLVIKNFALIENQTIEFKKGFNVLVGETGAGKSLILDALGFALGDKANKINLRTGETKMFVQAVFDEVNADVCSFLNDQGVDAEENLILSRSYTVEGKNECRINGVVVPTATLAKFAMKLGHKAVAVTDHNSLQAYPDIFNALQKMNNHPIVYL